MEKSAAIHDALSQLRRRFGATAFDAVDYWPADPDTIGIALPGGDEPVVCIMTAGKAPGRYDVQHGGTVYSDCVIQGLEWAAQQVLREQRHAEPGTTADVGRKARRRW